MNRKEHLALDFKSATLYAVRVVLHSHETNQLDAALDRRMSDAGSFFENEAVVIDATGVTGAVDWDALTASLRRHLLHPVGVVADGDNLEAALKSGLTQVDLSAPVARPHSTPADDKDVPPVKPPENTGSVDRGPSGKVAAGSAGSGKPSDSGPAPAAPPQVAPAALVINRPLRSGQRIYARDTDLIVIGMVSQGAEVIADGNIHVYGPLRGKAMAGARGDASARIFTTQLDPELVAIAGVYRVIETRLDASLHNQPTLIQRDGDTLQINALGK